MSLAVKNQEDISVLINYLREALKKSKGKITLKVSGQEKSLEVSDTVIATLIEQKEANRNSMSIKEVAAALRFRETTVNELITEGKIPTFKQNGELRIITAELEKYKTQMLAERRKGLVKLSQLSQDIGLQY